MMFAGDFGALPAQHSDRIAWSNDRVHNGPTEFYKLLKSRVAARLFCVCDSGGLERLAENLKCVDRLKDCFLALGFFVLTDVVVLGSIKN